MLETKEQIRTELINELIEWNDKCKFNQRSWLELVNKLRSMLPTETPEKIAERKAVEILKSNGWTIECVAYPDVQSMLIEALLTDIKTK